MDLVIGKLPALVQAAESAITEPLRGKDKLNAVLQAILVLVPKEEAEQFMQTKWPTIQDYVASLVEFYTFVGFFKRQP